MYRVSRRGSGTLYGNNYIITTHSEDSSSNTEVNNRVFANFNSSSQRLSTRSLLTQRNNDYMKFSWDPMQVVNISRQQKAVCNREIEKLRGLEKYFTRQNHIESYKQSSEIDKFRAKLVRLNNLRMPSEPENKRSGATFFPITKSSRRQYIGNSTSTTSYSKASSSLERNANFTKRTEISCFDKKFSVFNKGINNPSVYYDSTYTNPTLLGQNGEAKFKIKTCQRAKVNSQTVLRHSPRSDKQAINYAKRQPRFNNRLLDVNITSVSSSIISDRDISQLTKDEIVSPRNRKNVRFNEETETLELNKSEYDGRKFTQLVKLANSISGK